MKVQTRLSLIEFTNNPTKHQLATLGVKARPNYPCRAVRDSCIISKTAIHCFVVSAYKALLVLSFSLLVGCSKTSTEPKLDEPILTPIEDSDFSHDVEADDGEWDGFETVHAQLTAQWYVDPNDPEWGWNVERPGYVLREREVFLDSACFSKLRLDGGNWIIHISGPDFNVQGDWPPQDSFL